MNDLTSLIDRIEAATEGSRELDGDIALLVGWEPTHDRQSTLKWSDTYPSCRERWIGDRAPFNNWRVPHYSTSIDAALTLLPEGWWWSAGVCRRENHASVGTEIGTVEGELIFETFGATAPLALLAAILRARQAAQSGQAQTEARG